LPRLRFPRPLAEPDVRLSPHPALHRTHAAAAMTAQRCSLVCISRTRVCGAAAFAAASSGIAIPLCSNPAAALRHVAGFPDLGLLRRLRPTPNRSADGAPSPPPRRTHGLRQERSGSRVHSLIAGRRRHPTLPLRHRRGYNPQHVTTASPSAPNRHPQEFPTTPTEVGARRLRPVSTRFEPVPL